MAGPTTFPSWGGGGSTGSTPSTTFPSFDAAFSGAKAKPQKPKKQHHSWWEQALEAVANPAPVGGDLIAKYAPSKILREAGRIESVLAGAPSQAAQHPGLTITQAAKSITGLPEMSAALGRMWMAEERKAGGGTGGGLHADKAVLEALIKGAGSDYAKRYGKDYKQQESEQPFSNLMDALTVLGSATRVTALAGAGRRLGEAGVARTPGSLWTEAAQPGKVSTGKAFEKTLTYTTPEGTSQPVPRTVSRSPLRRAVQDMGAALSEGNPEWPIIGSRSRVTRALPNTIRRSTERALGSVIGGDALAKLSKPALTRLYWMAQLGNKDSTPVLQEWRNTLGRIYHDSTPTGNAPFDEFMAHAKQLGFGEKLLKNLDDAIKYEPDQHYAKAWDALRKVTEMSEQTQKDANGFSSLATDMKRASDHLDFLHRADATPEAISAAAEKVAALQGEIGDKASQLHGMFTGRRGIVQDLHLANRISDGPERKAWLEALPQLPNFTPEEAQGAIQFADMLAAATPDPNEFWRTRVGSPSEEPAQQFMSRLANAFYQQAPEATANTQRVMEDTLGMTPTGERTSVYYSDLQRVLADPRVASRMPAEQMAKTLENAIKPREWDNSGLDMYFNQFKSGEMVSKEAVKNHLGITLNAYDLEEVHLVNDPDLPEEMQTTWDKYGGKYMSRNPAPGEYHEIVMKMPGTPQGRGIFGEIHGVGEWHHWGRNDVVFHVRYHVFEEDGVRKLLVEEVQSDWESIHRKQKQEGYDIPKALPRDAHEFLTYAEQRIEQIRELQDQIDGNHPEWHALNQEEHQLLDDVHQLELIHPSPLGKDYHRAALRRVMREAAEQNVDQVINTDPRVQTVRNSDSHPLLTMVRHDRPDNGISSPGEVNAWFDSHPDAKGFSGWSNLYGKTHSKVLKEYGLTPTTEEAAYQGRYSTQGATFSPHGDMPGTVFHMTPEARAQALQPSALYQRQPNWGALPKGANELLANGDRAIRMFQGADISTWIHELAHSAVYDLNDADRKIIEGHYGGGTSIEAWKDSMHENYARDFELWSREGRAPNAALREVFARISTWMKAIYRKVDETHQIPDDVRQVFENMFQHRGGDTPDVFIPHRANLADLSGLRTSRGIPRANREIGDSVKSTIPLYAKNRLALLRSGMLNDDPRHAFEHLTRGMMLARANQLRETVLHLGVPIDNPTDWNPATQYIVKRAGSGVDKPLHDALEHAENPDEIRSTIKNYLDEHITDDEEKVKAWVEGGQLYKVDKKTVDSLFMHATGRKPGAATAPKTTGGKVIDAGLDSLRSLLLYANPGFYMANMVGNGFMAAISDPRAFRYFPESFANSIRKATGKGHVDPLWDQITVEMGRGPTAGQLSSDGGFLGQKLRSRSGHVGGTAEYISGKEHSWGARSGRVIDDSFRVAAWKQVASKRGFKTDLQQQRLLDEAVGHSAAARKMSKADRETAQAAATHELASIRDEAENLMLDFDSMTPFERQWLSRAIFLYPFLRASVKYPVMFAGERPVTAGLLGTTGTLGSQQADREFGPRDPSLPFWAQGYSRMGPGSYANFGSVSPFQPLLGILQSLETVGGTPPIGVQRPWSYLIPGGQLAAELAKSQNKYGRDATAGQILHQDFPMPGWMGPLVGRNPSAQFTNRGELAAFLRSLRVVPFGMGTQSNPQGGGGFTNFPEFPPIAGPGG